MTKLVLIRMLKAYHIFLVLGVILCYLVGFVPTDVLWFGSILTTLVFPLGFLLLIHWLMDYRKAKRFLLTGSIGLLLFIFNFTTWFNLNLNPEKGKYKVTSFNIRLFDIYNWLERKTWTDWAPRTDNGKILNEIYSMLDSTASNILCLQEHYYQPGASYATNDSLSERMGLKYQHVVYASDDYTHNVHNFYGIGTFSKFPITKKQYVPFHSLFNNGCLITDIVFPEDTIRVFNAHFESFRFSKDQYDFLNELSDNKGVLFQRDLLSFLNSMQASYEERAKQIRFIDSLISASPYKVILACDMNETVNSYGYHTFTERLQDSFIQKGLGLGGTLSNGLPIRIDFVFMSKGIDIKSYNITPKALSDHYPLTSTFDL